MENEIGLDAYSEKDSQKGKYLTFILGDEVYAVEIQRVREIISILPITTIPELPVSVKGIINLRGEVIPVMDVRIRFRKETVEYDLKTCIVIINVNDISLGLIVDSVCEVLNIEPDKVLPNPNTGGNMENSCIKAIAIIEDQIRLIIACDKLLDYEEIRLIR